MANCPRCGQTTRHLDYHTTARPMAAMEIDYPSGASTGLHAHPRCQLLYAIEGVMIVRSAAGAWVVPPNRAVWLVAGLDHEVRMCGAVKIRTVFVDPQATSNLPQTSCVIAVSALMRELILAAMRVPLDYQPHTRNERPDASAARRVARGGRVTTASSDASRHPPKKHMRSPGRAT
jgi:quercetin dioxygenase-like cupin family protein